VIRLICFFLEHSPSSLRLCLFWATNRFCAMAGVWTEASEGELPLKPSLFQQRCWLTKNPFHKDEVLVYQTCTGAPCGLAHLGKQTVTPLPQQCLHACCCLQCWLL
jgi:hypothetical protein